MALSKKYIAGIAAVATVTAYSFVRRRSNSEDLSEQSTAEDWTPADD